MYVKIIFNYILAYAKIGIKILSTKFIRQDQLLVHIHVGSMCLSNTYL